MRWELHGTIACNCNGFKCKNSHASSFLPPSIIMEAPLAKDWSSEVTVCHTHEAPATASAVLSRLRGRLPDMHSLSARAGTWQCSILQLSICRGGSLCARSFVPPVIQTGLVMGLRLQAESARLMQRYAEGSLAGCDCAMSNQRRQRSLTALQSNPAESD